MNKTPINFDEPSQRHSTNEFIDVGKLGETQCKKNNGHASFIAIGNLRARDLPHPFCKDERWAAMLRERAADTVMIKVYYTSKDRPDTVGWANQRGTRQLRIGSGTAFGAGLRGRRMRCDLGSCNVQDEHHEVYGPFYVVTVGHLIFDETEALSSSIEFFYDSAEDFSAVCHAEVTGLIKGSQESNRCVLQCVTHDARIPERLERARQERERLLTMVQEEEGSSMVVLISHPHGCSKHVSFGELRSVEEKGPPKKTRDGSLQLTPCVLTYSTPSCAGSGGGSVTLWKRGQRAFAPHSSAREDCNLSALGWMSK